MELNTKRQMLVVGDRVLIIPDNERDRTAHGLYLPPTVKERDKVHSGYILKVGPGYPVPNPNFIDSEPWAATPREPVKYIPLQAEEGDYALFLRDHAIDVEFEETKYVIVAQSSILLLIRKNVLDGLNAP